MQGLWPELELLKDLGWEQEMEWSVFAGVATPSPALADIYMEPWLRQHEVWREPGSDSESKTKKTTFACAEKNRFF